MPDTMESQELAPIDERGRIDAHALIALRDAEKRDEKERRRCWWFVVWPESCNMGKLLRLFDESHLPIAVSPLHCMDYKEDGTKDKDHYHVIVRFPNAKALDPVRHLVGSWLLAADGLMGLDKQVDPVWYVKPVEDYATCLRYLCHLDTPDKAQYRVNEVITFGYIDVSMLYAKSLADDVHAFAELLAMCRQNPRMSWGKFCNMVFDKGDMVLLRALRSNTYMLRSYLSSVSDDAAAQDKKQQEGPGSDECDEIF